MACAGWLAPWPASMVRNGLSQSSTRLWTCDSKLPTTTAPPTESSRPNTIQLVRSVAT